MVRAFKKSVAAILTAALVTVSAVSAFAASSPTEGNKPVNAKDVEKANGTTVTTKKSGNAAVSNLPKNTKNTEVVKVANTVKVKKVSYKIVRVKANAFKNNKSAKKVYLGQNVRTIDHDAFSGLTNLKAVVIKNKGSVSFSKNAFKGVNTKKVHIKVSSKMSDKDFKALQKSLKRAGFKGKLRRVNNI